MNEEKIAELIDELLRQPTARLAKVEKLFHYYGYGRDRTRGSYRYYNHSSKGYPAIKIKADRGKVKKWYILDAIDVFTRYRLLREK